jgi:hypothetical protein
MPLDGEVVRIPMGKIISKGLPKGSIHEFSDATWQGLPAPVCRQPLVLDRSIGRLLPKAESQLPYNMP